PRRARPGRPRVLSCSDRRRRGPRAGARRAGRRRAGGGASRSPPGGEGDRGGLAAASATVGAPPQQQREEGEGEDHADLQGGAGEVRRSEEHTSELQSRFDLVCRLLLENKNEA